MTMNTMNTNSTLLIELLTEELPPKALSKLGAAFADAIFNSLKSRDFLAADAVATTYATPRRLAVSITQVRATSPDKSIREKILPVSIALNAQGEPTAPLLKKLAALGFADISINDLERAEDGKAESFFYTYTAQGVALQQGLQAVLDDAVSKLPIPKLMSYQRPDGSTVQFVRPAHQLIALYGTTVVPVSTLGLQAGNSTLGHRFLTSNAADSITIADANNYADVLATQGKVIASFTARKDKIRAALLEKAGSDQVLMPEALLDEVTALVEWPVIYECHFEQEFLTVPQECLILTMQTNQKYFALTDAQGKLRSRFLIVSNLETADPQHIISGNERVVRPRLSDAKFFFEQDKKKTLMSRFNDLGKVVYHNKFEHSSMKDRSERVVTLAGVIAKKLEAFGANADYVEEAAKLAKIDLLTDMVGEFPELQGIMGTYYARNEGKPEEIALAISEHYQPRFSGDTLPTTITGTCLALADKLETLVGIWGIGLQPTGDKDPFALRRHTVGILRILLEKQLPLSLHELLENARDAIIDNKFKKIFAGEKIATNESGKVSTISGQKLEEIESFFFDRLRSYLRERTYTAHEIEAVIPQDQYRLNNPPEPLDTFNNIIERLNAVQAFAALPEAESLAAANKRITNILKKTDIAPGKVQNNLLQEAAEQALHTAMMQVKPQVDDAFAQGDFTTTLKTLAQLRDPVDAFFTNVMVMADDPALRNNRIALLSELHAMMNQVADISKLAA